MPESLNSPDGLQDIPTAYIVVPEALSLAVSTFSRAWVQLQKIRKTVLTSKPVEIFLKSGFFR